VIGTGGGAAIGALGSALVEWAKAATQGKQQRKADAARREHEAAEAKATREANAAEKEAQRQHDAAEAEAQRQRDAAQRDYEQCAAQRAERAEKIREWREGLAASHEDFEKWYAIQRSSRPKPSSFEFAVEPNIVSAPWFQSLRPHLSTQGEPGKLRSGNDIQCDSLVADTLASEIADIESAWRD
jgi:flagellar biosynthesis GTPase FlhF